MPRDVDTLRPVCKLEYSSHQLFAVFQSALETRRKPIANSIAADLTAFTYQENPIGMKGFILLITILFVFLSHHHTALGDGTNQRSVDTDILTSSSRTSHRRRHRVVIYRPRPPHNGGLFKKHECTPCRSWSECSQRKCWGFPARCTDGTDSSLRRCFAQECAPCRSSLQCSTKLCEKNKCVYPNDTSRGKCFGSGVNPKRPECAFCSRSDECQTGKCWGSPAKCVHDNADSLRRCFAAECAPCFSSLQCSTKLCRNGKCIYPNIQSLTKCLPPPKKPECESCLRSEECQTGKCWGSPLKCVHDNADSLRKCFSPECAPCKNGLECSTKLCENGKCIYDAFESRSKCFPLPKKPECQLCSSGEQCESGKCWGSPAKCVYDTDESLRKCFLAECAPCTSSAQCSTKLCENGKCVYPTTESKEKCFKKDECEPCNSREECKSNKCWGRRCTDGSDESLRRCFTAECESCERKKECSTKNCESGKCVYKTNASREKCLGSKKRPECAFCQVDGQCKQGTCFRMRCTDGTRESRRRCFKQECRPCKKKNECMSGICYKKKCIRNSDASKKRCFPDGI